MSNTACSTRRATRRRLAEIVKRLENIDVVFLGEQHDDAVGHAVQFEIYKQAVATYYPGRKVGLTLEMFERDVQLMLDEYLSGQISETHLISSTRAWGNYKTDYKPLVELAKEKRLPVIAANAASPVCKHGLAERARRCEFIIQRCQEMARSAAVWRAFGGVCKEVQGIDGAEAEAQMGIDKILASQSLWDATMADSVAKFLKKNEKSLVVHLNGSFHTENRLGTVEHLLRYRSKARVLVVTIRYEEDFRNFNSAKHTDLGDFVILTDAKQPRSKR